jgi:hypothetical protein
MEFVVCLFCKKEILRKPSLKAIYCSKECYRAFKVQLNKSLTERKCTKCLVVKPNIEYYPNKKLSSGVSTECKDCSRKRAREDAAKNREKNNQKSKEYHYKYREKNLARMKEKNLKIRNKVLHAYGGEQPYCNCCHETIKQFLTVDHINNDGAEHRKSLSKGKNKTSSLYRWLVKNNFPKDFQLLCWNCNTAKFRYGKCPHKE